MQEQLPSVAMPDITLIEWWASFHSPHPMILMASHNEALEANVYF